MSRTGLVLILLIIVSACDGPDKQKTDQKVEVKTATINYTLEGSLPHDVNSFTEGLFVYDNQLFESTGSPQEYPSSFSHFGIVDTLSGKINVKASLDKARFFGEGISILNGKLYQLTWRSKICFIYDANSFKLLNSSVFPNAEGWGLTNDGTHLIMSDGTSKLTYFKPDSFEKVKQITVTENGSTVKNLNELEYVDGFIYANIWMTNTIVKVEASSGKVVAKADFSKLYQDAFQSNSSILEMNGIAYDDKSDEFLLTGKFWPKIYRVKFL